MIQATGSHFLQSNKLSSIDNINYYIQDKNDIIYEVIRFIDFKPLFLEDHIDRFLFTFKLLPEEFRTQTNQILKGIQLLIEKNGISFGNIRFQYNNNQINSFCAWLVPHIYPTTRQYSEGVRVQSIQAQRRDPNTKARDIQLRQHADDLIREHDIYEVIFMNHERQITEGSRSNIFFIQDDFVVTPPMAMVLPGITRQKIIDIIHHQKLRIKEKLIPISEINKYVSCFISGTSPKILPVSFIDKTWMDVSNPILQKLINLYNRKIDLYIEKFKWI